MTWAAFWPAAWDILTIVLGFAAVIIVGICALFGAVGFVVIGGERLKEWHKRRRSIAMCSLCGNLSRVNLDIDRAIEKLPQETRETLLYGVGAPDPFIRDASGKAVGVRIVTVEDHIKRYADRERQRLEERLRR